MIKVEIGFLKIAMGCLNEGDDPDNEKTYSGNEEIDIMELF